MADENPTPAAPTPEPPPGPLTPEGVALLIERATAPLVERLANLEDNQSGDGAAFAAQYQVTEEGAVEINESEVINELVSEEGDLIVGGKGKKARVLKRGKAGQVLGVNAEGELEWQEPGGGGGGFNGIAGRDELSSLAENSGIAKVLLPFEPKQVLITPLEDNDPELVPVGGQTYYVTREPSGFSVLSVWPPENVTATTGFSFLAIE